MVKVLQTFYKGTHTHTIQSTGLGVCGEVYTERLVISRRRGTEIHHRRPSAYLVDATIWRWLSLSQGESDQVIFYRWVDNRNSETTGGATSEEKYTHTQITGEKEREKSKGEGEKERKGRQRETWEPWQKHFASFLAFFLICKELSWIHQCPFH